MTRTLVFRQVEEYKQFLQQQNPVLDEDAMSEVSSDISAVRPENLEIDGEDN